MNRRDFLKSIGAAAFLPGVLAAVPMATGGIVSPINPSGILHHECVIMRLGVPDRNNTIVTIQAMDPECVAKFFRENKEKIKAVCKWEVKA